jgi:hypothetical protein
MQDVGPLQIEKYGVTQISVVDGVLYKDGKPLYDPDVPVRVSISLPCLSANALQGILSNVKVSKYGLISIEIYEREVNKSGYYCPSNAPCSDKFTEVTTYNIHESFLQWGWTEEQGNTAGFTIPFSFKNHNPHSHHRPRADVAYII